MELGKDHEWKIFSILSGCWQYISDRKDLVHRVHLFSHRPQEIGRAWVWSALEKIARYENIENHSSDFQNGLAFLGDLEKQVYSSVLRSMV